jgi:hypothetical protein
MRKPRNPYAKRGQCDYSKTGWSWQYANGACLCDPCPPPDGWKYNKKQGEWMFLTARTGDTNEHG